jgi:hypothetical protein
MDLRFRVWNLIFPVQVVDREKFLVQGSGDAKWELYLGLDLVLKLGPFPTLLLWS